MGAATRPCWLDSGAVTAPSVIHIQVVSGVPLDILPPLWYTIGVGSEKSLVVSGGLATLAGTAPYVRLDTLPTLKDFKGLGVGGCIRNLTTVRYS
jgi:hypothetical protein